MLKYFRYQRHQILVEINRYFEDYIHNHSIRTRDAILRDFAIFIERANEYEARVLRLVNSGESFHSVREKILSYVADLIDLSNEIIDMIM